MPFYRVTLYYQTERLLVEAQDDDDALARALDTTSEEGAAIDTWHIEEIDEQSMDPDERTRIDRAGVINAP